MFQRFALAVVILCSAVAGHAATFNVSGTTLQLNLTAANESVAISAGATNYTFALTGGTWSGTDSADATGNGTASLSAVKASFTAVTVDDGSTGNAVTFTDGGANTYPSNFTITLNDATAGAITFNSTIIFTGSAGLSATGGAITVVARGLVTTNGGNVTLVAANGVTVGGIVNSAAGLLAINADSAASGTGTLTVGANGSLLGATLDLRAAAMSIDSAATVGSATEGSVPASTTLTGLNNPYVLAFDGSGNLYVANLSASTVSKYAPGSTTPTATLTGLNGPRALAFDGSGNLYVANYNGNTVSKFAPGATTPTATLTGVSDPIALAFDGNGNLFVANMGGSGGGTVSKFAPGATTPTATLTVQNGPQALAFDGSGNLYVANYYASTVSKFAPGATTPTATLTGLSGPYGLACDGSGNLYATNYSSGQGTTVSKFAPGAITPTATLSGLNAPRALIFDGSGNLYVTNTTSSTNSVSKFAPGGTTPTATLTGLSFPEALAFDGSGNLFVLNKNVGTVTQFPVWLTTAATTSVTFRQSVSGQAINLGTHAAGALGLTNAELNRVFTAPTGTLNIGDANSGPITISAVISPAGYNTLSIQKGATFSATGGFSSTVTSASVYQKMQVNGALVIDPSATLTVTATGGFVPAAGDSFTIIANPSASTTTGAFSGKPQGFYYAIGGVNKGVIYTGGPARNSVVLSPLPTATASNAILEVTDTTLTIYGNYFDPTLVNNTVTFNNGVTGTITAATATSLTVSITIPPGTKGNLAAFITTNGIPSSASIVVAALPANITATLTAGSLVITDIGSNDAMISLSQSGGDLIISADALSNIATNVGTGSRTSNVSIPLASITGSITLNAGAGNDTLNIGSFISNTVLNNALIIGSGAGTSTLNFNGSFSAASLSAAAGTITVTTGAMVATTGGNLTLAAVNGVTINSVVSSGAGALAVNADSGASGTGTLTVNANGGLYGATLDLQAAAVSINNAATVGNAAGGHVSPTAPFATLTGLLIPHALAFDGSGNLFVANSFGSTVSQFAPGATTPTATLTGVGEAEALAFDGGGNLYVANNNGTTVSKFEPGATTPTATLTGLNYPQALALDGSGNLYVANNNGTTVSKFEPGATTPTATLTGLSNPRALAFDGSGNLYVANLGGDTVSQFAPGATTPTATLTGLNKPQALAFDGSGNLYVANSGNGNGTTVSKFAPGATTPTATLTGLNGPVALAFDGGGNLYVANYGNGSGTTVSKFAPGATTPTATLRGLAAPHALAFDGSGNHFVANASAHTVSKFAPGGVTAATTSVTFRQSVTGQAINLGTDTAGALSLTNSELNRVFVAPTGSLTIGDANSGAVTISGVISPAGCNTLAIQKGVTFTATGGFASTVTSASVYQQMQVNGPVVIDPSARLTVTTTGGFVPAEGDSFTIIANTSASTTTGAFTGKPQGIYLTLGGVFKVLGYDRGVNGNNVVLWGPPLMFVQQPAGNVIGNGGSTSFTKGVGVGYSALLTFTVTNPGTASLSGLGVTIDGANAGEFSVQTAPASTVAPGGSTTFTIQFTPASSGSKTAALHVANSLPGGINPYNISLSAKGATTYTVTAATDAALRAAVTSARTDSLGGVVAFNIPGGGTIALTSTLPTLANTIGILIDGTNGGQGPITIDGGSTRQIFVVAAGNGNPVTLRNLTLARGKAVGTNGANATANRGGGGGGGGAGLGGAVLVNTGALTLEGVSFSGNQAVGGNGGSGATYVSGTGTSGGAGGGNTPLSTTGGAATNTATGSGPAGGTGGYGAGGGGGGATSNVSTVIAVNGGVGGDGGLGGGSGGGGRSNAATASVARAGGTAGAFGGSGGTSSKGAASSSGGGGGGGGAALGGAVFVRSGAALTVRDRTNFSGNSVTGGAAGANAASASAVPATAGSGAGASIFLDGVSPTMNIDSGTVTLSDSIGTNGAVGLTKSGAGTLNLTGLNSYTGGTIINGGVLQVNETITASVSATGVGPVTVNNGGTLAGGNSGGTVGSVRGDVTVNSGGSIAPGSSGPGILTVNGNATLSSGAGLNFAMNGASLGTGYAQLQVNGTVNLGGATLTLSGTYFPPTVGQTFTILSSSGGVTGTFAGLAEGATVTLDSARFSISYLGSSGTTVVLTSLPSPDIAVSQTLALTDNVSSVDFGTVTLGSSSAAKTFTITNPGTADLTSLAITKDGTNASDFTVSALSDTSVPVGSGSVTFSVTFTPSASGSRSAGIHITSNVSGAKNPFDITLTGTAESVFQAWATANGTTTDNANLPSFAFGTAPGATGDLSFSGSFATGGAFSHGGHVTKLESTTNGVDFRALFVRRKDRAAAGLTYTPQFGTDDLGTWVDSTATPTVIADDGDFELVSIPYPPSIGKKKVRFFRLGLTLNP